MGTFRRKSLAPKTSLKSEKSCSRPVSGSHLCAVGGRDNGEHFAESNGMRVVSQRPTSQMPAMEHWVAKRRPAESSGMQDAHRALALRKEKCHGTTGDVQCVESS